MALTMTDEQEGAQRYDASKVGEDVQRMWIAELDATRARVAAREAECAELRAALDTIRKAVGYLGTEHNDEAIGVLDEWLPKADATLSRPSGDFAALRAMLMQLSGMAWADLAPSREVDVRLAEAWVARLLPSATQAQEGSAE